MADWGKLLLLYVFLHVVRLAMMLALLPALRRTGYALDWRAISVMSYAGLRGAVGLALAVLVGTDPKVDRRVGDLMLFHMAGIAALTLLVRGHGRHALQRAGASALRRVARRLEARRREPSAAYRHAVAACCVCRVRGALRCAACTPSPTPRALAAPARPPVRPPARPPARLRAQVNGTTTGLLVRKLGLVSKSEAAVRMFESALQHMQEQTRMGVEQLRSSELHMNADWQQVEEFVPRLDAPATKDLAQEQQERQQVRGPRPRLTGCARGGERANGAEHWLPRTARRSPAPRTCHHPLLAGDFSIARIPARLHSPPTTAPHPCSPPPRDCRPAAAGASCVACSAAAAVAGAVSALAAAARRRGAARTQTAKPTATRRRCGRRAARPAPRRAHRRPALSVAVAAARRRGRARRRTWRSTSRRRATGT